MINHEVLEDPSFREPQHVFPDYLKDDYTKSPKSLLITCVCEFLLVFVSFLHVSLGAHYVPFS